MDQEKDSIERAIIIKVSAFETEINTWLKNQLGLTIIKVLTTDESHKATDAYFYKVSDLYHCEFSNVNRRDLLLIEVDGLNETPKLKPQHFRDLAVLLKSRVNILNQAVGTIQEVVIVINLSEQHLRICV